jgi:hypothetical protein
VRGFDEAGARLHGEAVTLVAEVAGKLTGNPQILNKSCEQAGQRLRALIDEANAIASGEALPDPADSDSTGGPMLAVKPRSTLCSAPGD